MFFLLSLLLASCNADEAPQLQINVPVPPQYGQYQGGNVGYGNVADVNTQLAQNVNEIFAPKIIDPIFAQSAASQIRSANFDKQADYWKKETEKLRSSEKIPEKPVPFEKGNAYESLKNYKKNSARGAGFSQGERASEGENNFESKSKNPELESLYSSLYELTPQYEKEKVVRELGLLSIVESDESYAIGEWEDGDFFKALGKDFLDIAVGIDPVSGLGRNAYEFYTGKNIVTGKALSHFERGLAVVGVVSLGTTNTGAKLLKIAEKVRHRFVSIERVTIAFKYGNEILKTKIGRTLQVFRTSNRVDPNSTVNQKYPKNGEFARLIPKEFAEGIKNGTGKLSPENEAFITAWEDVSDYTSNGPGIAERLTLLEKDGTYRKITEEYVFLRFKIDKPIQEIPIEDVSKYTGYLSGGTTLGQAREYVIKSDAVMTGVIDRTTIRIVELFK